MVYNLFISHSWTYSDSFIKLVAILNSNSYFNYKSHSVPKNDPRHHARYDSQLKEAIKSKMRPACCVLILSGVYATYGKWINLEIELAQEMGKPIIAVEPWGAERTSAAVNNAADKIVGWNTYSIISAIRECC